jgi:hypothetical protein
MANPLFNSLGNNNPFQRLMEEAREFRKSFSGNPREEVQRLLNSGQMSQEQFNHFSRIATQVAQMMGKY